MNILLLGGILLDQASCIGDIILFFDRSDEEVFHDLQEQGYYRRRGRCNKGSCRQREMRLVKNAAFKAGFKFRCPHCGHCISPTKKTFFENSPLSVSNIFQLMFLFVNQVRATCASGLLNMSKGSIVKYYKCFADICTWKISSSPQLFKFGGPGVTVQMDECTVAEIKRERGGRSHAEWILGIYDCTLRQGMAFYIPDRRRETFLEHVRRHVQPGTTVYTDESPLYQGLDTLGYDHHTVQHSRNFRDPVAETCTNTVENYWTRVRGCLKRFAVLHSPNLPKYIGYFLWADIYGFTGRVPFSNFLNHIRERYPQ